MPLSAIKKNVIATKRIIAKRIRRVITKKEKLSENSNFMRESSLKREKLGKVWHVAK
jgi:hypothetical protein